MINLMKFENKIFKIYLPIVFFFCMDINLKF